MGFYPITDNSPPVRVCARPVSPVTMHPALFSVSLFPPPFHLSFSLSPLSCFSRDCICALRPKEGQLAIASLYSIHSNRKIRNADLWVQRPSSVVRAIMGKFPSSPSHGCTPVTSLWDLLACCGHVAPLTVPP